MSINDFQTADESESGVKLPLFDKYGEKTEEWIQVRGIDSLTFRNAKLESDRKTLELLGESDQKKRRIKILDLKFNMIATLVVDWSQGFKDDVGDPTIENVVKFFNKAPQVADEIDKLAGNRKLFFSLIQNNSSSGAESKPS